MAVWLNVDLGELDHEPAELYQTASIVNIACGGHAGDLHAMRRACRLATSAGTRIFAHPSYPDRDGFGRVSLRHMPIAELEDSLMQQLISLRAVASEMAPAVSIRGMKPHGALYHDCSRDEPIARCVLGCAESVFGGTLEIVGEPDGALSMAAPAAGLVFLREGFADRGYGADGRLLNRSQVGAVLDSPLVVREQAVRLAQAGVSTPVRSRRQSASRLLARHVRDALVEARLLRAGP
jgi:UPF0271 protein